MDQQHRAFIALYEANLQDLIKYALRRSNSQHEALEIVAETMLVAWRRIDDVPAGAQTRLWLFGVARNVMNNSRRSSKRQKRLIEKLVATIESSTEDVNPLPGHHVLAVREALAELRPIEAEVIRLSVWEELSPIEIANHLLIPPETVRTHLHRGRLKLRVILGHVVVSDSEDFSGSGD